MSPLMASKCGNCISVHHPTDTKKNPVRLLSFNLLTQTMEFTLITVVGLLAATCTTISFLPQVIKTWKSKSAKDLSLGMFSIFATGVFLWLVYGLMIGDLPIILANTITLLLVLLILYFKFTFDRNEESGG